MYVFYYRICSCSMWRWLCHSAGLPRHCEQQWERLHSYVCWSRTAERLSYGRSQSPWSTCRRSSHVSTHLYLWSAFGCCDSEFISFRLQVHTCRWAL